jgi:predicted enzyme related to lactoylglutathione lyase
VSADLRPQRLLYIVVIDVEASVSRCEKPGGRVLLAPKRMGDFGKCFVIQDTAGAVAALFEPNSRSQSP